MTYKPIIMDWTIIANAWGLTLLHSVWQALIVSAVLRLLLLLFKNAPARLRYQLMGGALATIFLWFVVTCCRQLYGQLAAHHLEAAAGLVPATSGVVFLSSGGDAAGASWRWAGLVPWLDMLYVAGLLVFSGKLLKDLMVVTRIRRTRTTIDPHWISRLTGLTQRWEISRKVGLYLSPRIDVPLVIGYMKPVIYLPLSIVCHLDAVQIEAILLHELAHIKRADFLINALQTGVETLLFFNPFVWWISKQMRRERECCCDELVVGAADPGVYAGALLALEESRLYHGRFVLAAKGSGRHLFHRIKRMMEMNPKKPNVVQKLMVLCLLVGSVLSVSWLVPRPGGHSSADTPPPVQSMPTVSLPVVSVRDSVSPPAPAVPAVPAVPSAPDAPATPAPPTPPTPPAPPAAPDSVASLAREIRQANARIRQFYQGPQWEQYRKAMEDYRRQMQQYIKSDSFRLYQQALAGQAADVAKYFNRPAWRQQQEMLTDMAGHIRDSIGSPAWADRFRGSADRLRQSNEALRNAMRQMERGLNSRALWTHNLGDSLHRRIGPGAFSADRFLPPRLLDGGHISADRIPEFLKRDGLLQGDSYDIRINDKGLYINGKKQDRRYGDRYRRLVGEHREVRIKQRKGKTQVSVQEHTARTDHTTNL